MLMLLGELRRIVREAASDSSDRAAFVAALIQKYPLLAPIEGSLRALGAIITSDDVDVVAAHEILTTDAGALAVYDTDPPQKNYYGKLEFVINQKRTNKKEHERTGAGSSKSKGFSAQKLKTLPRTAFKKQDLVSAAKLTGQKLFGSDRSGLVWGARTTAEVSLLKTTTYQMILEHCEMVGDEALDVTSFTPSTYEYVFFPSRRGQGLDASDELNFIDHHAEMTDSDGNIYLVSNEDGTLIRVVNPTVLNRELYEKIVNFELAES